MDPLDRPEGVDQPLVFVVILNWNGWRDTLACLASLRALTYTNVQVVLVDNGSTDGSEERIRAAHPDLLLLQTGANRGFAGGNNPGIRHALEHGADYVWLLNNDALAQPDALSVLVARAQSDLRIGFVGSKILYASQPDLVWFAGGVILTDSGCGTHVPFNVPDDENLPPAHEPMFLTGCSLLVRREVIEQIGGLPELYFLYYEEVDWQFTGRKQGWKVMYEPASVVLHRVSLAAGIDTPVAAFHSARSRMIFVRRHLRGARRRAVLDLLRRDGVRLAKRRRWRAALASCRGIASGLVTPTYRHAGTEESPGSSGSQSAALKASATVQPAQFAQAGVVSEARTDGGHGG